MQLSRLSSALLHIHHTYTAGSFKPLYCLSASVFLLGGSPLALAQTDEATETPPSAMFDFIVVTTSADASAQGLPVAYEGGQVATGSRVGLLGNQDIMDTPFSTTAYTNEYIKNQQAHSVGDLLKKDPTVRVARGFGNFQEAYLMRGFVTNSDDTMFNGLYGILPRQYIATELFERVELQRGASAMLNGAAPSRGNAGGSINLLPKRAGNEPLRQLTLGYGAGDQGRVGIDISDRFGQDDAVGVRFNAAYQDGDSAVDNESAKLGLAALGLDYRADKYRVSADFGWQDNKLDETRPNVTLSGVTAVPEAPKGDKNWAQPWSYSNEKDLFGTVRAEYDFQDNLTGYAAYGARKGEEENSLANLTVTNTDGTGSTYRFDNTREDKVQSAQLGLRGKLQLGNTQHNWTLAGDLYDQELKTAYVTGDSLATNLYRPTAYKNSNLKGSSLGVNLSDPRLASETQLTSVALADTISLMDDKLKATLGVRHQNIEARSYDYSTQVKSSDYDDSEWTPSVGLVYQPNKDWSVYGNYIESLSQGEIAPAESANAGEALSPYVSKQSEIGLKYDNGTVGSSLAIYHTTQPRAYVNDANIFVEAGENRHQGVELTVFGSPAENLRFNAGVSYLDAKQTDTDSQASDGKRVIGIPKLQSNFNLEYDVASVSGLTLTGDLIHTGSRYADAANTLKVDGYTTLDLGARYRTQLGKQDVTFKGMVTNVTGEDYWQSVGGYPGQGYLNAGEPTAVKVSATFDF